MGEFFKQLISSSNTPWIVGIITAAITGIFSLRKVRYEKREENNKLREDKKMESEKLRYEKRLEKFKETNESLFKDKKQEVLAAIATLGIFKRDQEFEKNTIDVLLSRLYTELDYDVINSILSTLIQDSDRNELLNIADGLQDINRNFFIQEHPMRQRINDVDDAVKKIEMSSEIYKTEEYYKNVKQNLADAEVFVKNKEDALAKYKSDFQELIALHKYKLKWHKQVTADAYAMFLRKAYLANKNGELTVRLFQNDFNYVYMAEVTTTETSISRSALSSATFAKVDFNKTNFQKNDFYASRFYECGFRTGIINASIFEANHFDDVIFENIHFETTGFLNCTFTNTKFLNCSGLTQDSFTDCRYIGKQSIFPTGISIESNAEYEARIQQAIAAENKQQAAIL